MIKKRDTGEVLDFRVANSLKICLRKKKKTRCSAEGDVTPRQGLRKKKGTRKCESRCTLKNIRGGSKRRSRSCKELY